MSRMRAPGVPGAMTESVVTSPNDIRDNSAVSPPAMRVAIASKFLAVGLHGVHRRFTGAPVGDEGGEPLRSRRLCGAGGIRHGDLFHG